MHINYLLLVAVLVIPTNGIFFRQFYDNVNQIEPFDNYDFVIIGSGSAGSVLARRLSERPDWRILLLEVGRRPTIISDVPFLAPALQFTDYCWNYQMEKTPGICLGMIDQRCPWPRGRGLGGTTLINYMIYTRGHKKDYELWAAQGNPGWSYKDVLPYFLKSEDANLRFRDEGYHAEGGPLSVEDIKFRTRIPDTFIQAGLEVGIPYIDYNGRAQEGFSYVQSNTRAGVRDSGYRAFIRPAETRSNLHILTESRATKLLIDPQLKKVYGVEYVRNRKYHYVNVSKEVILSAGAFNSPQLLMLSGIGPREHLQSLAIPVLQDLNVGRNLHDHITFLGMFYTIEGNVGIPNLSTFTSAQSFIQWLKYGQGPLTGLGGVEAIGYIHTNASTEDIGMPDMEIIVLTGNWDYYIADIMRKSVGITEEIFQKQWIPLLNKQFILFLPMHLKPKSIGHLELKSRNPYHWPKLFGNHLTDPENYDVKAFIATIRFIQRLSQTKAFQQYQIKYNYMILPGCENETYDSDAYWECSIRHTSTTLHHQVGTCKMGPKTDPKAVVDSDLKVHGIKRLRVADTSIIPFALNAHTNAPTYMIGEKASDLIKEEWSSK